MLKTLMEGMLHYHHRTCLKFPIPIKYKFKGHWIDKNSKDFTILFSNVELDLKFIF